MIGEKRGTAKSNFPVRDITIEGIKRDFQTDAAGIDYGGTPMRKSLGFLIGHHEIHLSLVCLEIWFGKGQL